MARAGLVLIAAVLLPRAAAAQEGALRQPARAFGGSISLSFALGFHGARAERIDTVLDRPGCTPCTLSYGPGGAPHVSLRVEEPVSRRTALRSPAPRSTGSRPNRAAGVVAGWLVRIGEPSVPVGATSPQRNTSNRL